MAEPTPPRQRPHALYIMPDGRPLTAALAAADQLRPPRHGAGDGGRRRPGQPKVPKDGWSKALPRSAVAAAAGDGGGGGAASDAEAAEMHALSRVGHRKQRRWLNDKLLRDMAGALTAQDMASLFKPVPFGEQRASAWERAARPEHAVLWDLFRTLDMDKQGRVLQKWEAHVRELQAGPAAIRNPAIDAIAAWAGVSSKARAAMKRSSPAAVQAIEAPILAFLQQDVEEVLVLAGLEDGFHRLIAHGLADFHGLASHSRPAPDAAGKEVVMRRRQGAAAAAAAAAEAAAAAAAAAPKGGSSAGSGGEWQDEEGGVPPPPPAHEEQPAPKISCADILHILVDAPQPLTPQLLHSAYCGPATDSSSEAGDHPERHPHLRAAQQQQQHGHHEQQREHGGHSPPPPHHHAHEQQQHAASEEEQQQHHSRHSHEHHHQ